MYDIVTIEPEDEIVQRAINCIIGRETNVTYPPKGGYRLIYRNVFHKEGDGGDSNVLVIVGHGSPNGLSGTKTWRAYCEELTAEIDWKKGKNSIFIVACSANGKGQKFGYGNFAREIKDAYPKATVWASSSAVDANGLEGDWKTL
jgi:hypothetical protein